eukprot:6874572-Prymnesium_polylepis.1
MRRWEGAATGGTLRGTVVPAYAPPTAAAAAVASHGWPVPSGSSGCTSHAVAAAAVALPAGSHSASMRRREGAVHVPSDVRRLMRPGGLWPMVRHKAALERYAAL